jgi:molecular chaperone DnaK
MPLVQRSLRTCDEALSLAGMAASQIDHVILVGGMTRYPLIREAVTQYFGRQPFADLNPDEVVAVGAAIQAHNLTNINADASAVLLDVTPQSLGVRTVGGFCEVLIPRNTPIPTQTIKAFHTAHDRQTEVRISIYQGESRMADGNEMLGEFVLGGLREAPRGEVKVRVTFEIDSDGIVQVLAEDVEHGRARDLRIEANSGLSEDEVSQMRFDDLGF